MGSAAIFLSRTSSFPHKVKWDSFFDPNHLSILRLTPPVDHSMILKPGDDHDLAGGNDVIVVYRRIRRASRVPLGRG
jgi:hypothetical protein